MSDDEEEIIGVKRYGADKNKLKEISKKKIQLTQLKSAVSDSSDESSTSSSSSGDESSGVEAVEDESDPDDPQAQTKKRMLETFKKKAQQAPSVRVPSIQQTRFRDDMTKLKSMLTTTDVDLSDEESEIEEIAPVKEKSKRRRLSISDDDDDIQSDHDHQQGRATSENDSEEEAEEEEDTGFKLKFSGDRPMQITVNPKRPLQEAFDQFRQKRGAIPDGARIIFKFDGTVLRGHETPESLDMDGGEQIDVTIK